MGEGVTYFESNNEPDLPAEWRNNHRPPNWLDIVVNNFIRDADGVLPRGGLLALPAMGPGSLDNPISLVVQKGRRDLFERGCWVAIHNYTLNHPLDYPYDDVNQTGRPLTQEEFDDVRPLAVQPSELRANPGSGHPHQRGGLRQVQPLGLGRPLHGDGQSGASQQQEPRPDRSRKTPIASTATARPEP